MSINFYLYLHDFCKHKKNIKALFDYVTSLPGIVNIFFKASELEKNICLQTKRLFSNYSSMWILQCNTCNHDFSEKRWQRKFKSNYEKELVHKKDVDVISKRKYGLILGSLIHTSENYFDYQYTTRIPINS